MGKYDHPPEFFQKLDDLQNTGKRQLLSQPLRYAEVKEKLDAAVKGLHKQKTAQRTVAVDFDGTCVANSYPQIGEDIGAVPWLQKASQQCKLILLTMRSGEQLDAALAWMAAINVTPWAVNDNPEQSSWSTSRKVYAHLYIDDSALGTPLIVPEHGKPYVDWSLAGPMLMGWLSKGG